MEQWLLEREQRGELRGEQKGRQQGETAVLLRQLEQWSLRVLDAAKLEEVLA